MKNLPDIINEALLMEKLGAAPKISAVASFLGESIPTTWRRVNKRSASIFGRRGQYQNQPKKSRHISERGRRV